MNLKDYFDTSTCDKCKDAEPKVRFHHGYVQCGDGGARFLRYWHLCGQCSQNAREATKGKQHPLWILMGDDLVLSDKTIWPEEERGRGYNPALGPPARNVGDSS